jgi:hypothetical protein
MPNAARPIEARHRKRRKNDPQITRGGRGRVKVMGDKSPKQKQKQAAQKQTQTNLANQRKHHALQQSKALTVQSSDQSNRATESDTLCLRQG